MKVKSSDYIAQFLKQYCTDTVFVFTGGAIAHIIDSLPDNNIKYICVQHEQTGAMAAEAYSRTTGKIGVSMATSGPGATNMITGIAGAWYDCIPSIYITGQVRTWELTGNDKLLQRGFQEVDIVNMVKSITKYATTITKIDDLRYILEKALYMATSGRPGPVLLDFPMNLQWETIDPQKMKSFIPDKKNINFNSEILLNIKEKIKKSKKPLVVAGGGIVHSNSTKEFINFIEQHNLPCVFSYAAKDILPFNHKLNCGVIGQFGNSYSNIILQSSDLIIGLGSRFSLRQTGNNIEGFVSSKETIAVNIDLGELKDGRLNADIKYEQDLPVFFDQLEGFIFITDEKWNQYILKVKEKNPVILPTDWDTKNVNPYIFYDKLSNVLDSNSIIIPDCGQNVIMSAQSFKIKKGQRFISSWANSPMGYSFPASIGA